MKHLAAVLLMLSLLSGCDISFNKIPPKVIASEPATKQQQRQVFEATVVFLQLLDSGKADQSWSLTSPLLKATTPEVIWSNTVKAMRLGLGTFVERKSANIGFTTHIDVLYRACNGKGSFSRR
ncbi:hypothetical protein PMI21_02776 [Pseudomonas sp. GM18]|uniref:DUF4019 domain-containing protein n=1 Tax=Pseudomonas sp. GM18 TaxID=1144324 RepID=UPI000272609B|nr:DUF4019 domain-containing protein [Pseudomonas sp. GM18]EJM17014.1 hypothetical protein PMI21_02776 [Pseudomonas sp. GM18]